MCSGATPGRRGRSRPPTARGSRSPRSATSRCGPGRTTSRPRSATTCSPRTPPRGRVASSSRRRCGTPARRRRPSASSRPASRRAPAAAPRRAACTPRSTTGCASARQVAPSGCSRRSIRPIPGRSSSSRRAWSAPRSRCARSRSRGAPARAPTPTRASTPGWTPGWTRWSGAAARSRACSKEPGGGGRSATARSRRCRDGCFTSSRAACPTTAPAARIARSTSAAPSAPPASTRCS